MNKVIIVRVCEIFLKGKNRFYFVNLLEENIKKALDGIKYDLVKLQMRYLVENFDEDKYDLIMSKLLKVCGIHTMSVAYCVESDVDKIAEAAIAECEDMKGSFKVETNRADKAFPLHSVELSAEIGGRILERYGKDLYVDVKKPKNILKIDIRENGQSLIYKDVIKGVGGMPVGSSGKGFLMLSGGIDSPVAGYMMAKRGMKLAAVHFHSYPYTSQNAKDKVIELAKIMKKYTGGFKLHIVSFTHIQESIHKFCDGDFMITLMRRIMFRIAERLAKQNNYQSIITGENLGQVASQTVESMTVTNAVVNDLPIFRPLISFDKEDISRVAQKIGTFETSILPYEDCCTVFLPKHPVIKPKLEKCLKEESKLNIEELISEALKNIEVIEI